MNETDVINKNNKKDWIPKPYQKYRLKLAKWFKEAIEKPHCELEGKIGKFNSLTKHFESTVSPSLFGIHLARCHRSVEHGSIFDKYEKDVSVTYLFANGVRGTEYSSNTLKKSEFVKKQKMSSWDICLSKQFEHSIDQNTVDSVRITHCVEIPAEAPCDNVTWVRMRQRESFYYKNTWRFDFSYVRQGQTKSLAQIAPLIHEIEIEYIGSLQNVSEDDCMILVISLLMKLNDLIHSSASEADFFHLLQFSTMALPKN